jgi:hypothetical protein
VEVYTAEEVKAALLVLGQHLSEVAYYRNDHETQRRNLYAVMQTARKSIGLPEFADTKGGKK